MVPNESTVPSVFKILFTDYWSFGLLILQVLAVLTVSVYGILALLLLTPYFVYRIRKIRRIFATGVETEGVVVHRSFSKGMFTATYEIEAGGRTVKTSDVYLTFKIPIQVGDRFPAVYDPESPRWAFLKPFWLKAGAE